MKEKISRNEFLKKGAVASSGVAALTFLGAGLVKTTKAKAQGSGNIWPAPYDTLDVEAVRIRAHDLYCSEGKGCGYGAFEGMVSFLREQLPTTFPVFPSEVILFSHGGVVGWGTICGAINGAAAVISLVCDKATSDMLISELCGWYTTELFPSDISNTYAVENKYSSTKSDEVLEQSACGSVLCHVSVTKWCEASEIGVKDIKRKERCGRLTGDVAAKAAELLNAHYGAGFTAEYVAPATISACMACHSTDGFKKNVSSKSECEQCHGDYEEIHTGAGNKSISANNFEVQQNFPNPFNNNTTIEFSLPVPEKVTIEVYNLNGQHIKTLVSNKQYSAGDHSLQWSGNDEHGHSVDSGMYFFRLRAGKGMKTLSMMKM